MVMSTRLVFADSKNRDATLYPSGNAYVLHLTTPLKNIERIDLVSARVPNTMYNLTVGSNVLSLNGTSNLSLNHGFYSTYGLAQAVTSTTLVTLDYLPDEGKFVFSAVSNFTLKLNSAELSKMLGIVHGTTLTSTLATSLDPVYSGKHIIKSSTLINMSLNEYVFLDIDELRTPTHVDARALESNGTVSGGNANRSFAPIMMDVGSACIKNFHENKDYLVSVNYPEPIASLQRLTVRWYDTDGRLLDFRGWDTNAFVLRLHIREQDPLPPPQPVENLEIRRIIEAMSMVPKAAPPKESPKGMKIPWWLFILVIVGSIVIWKSWPKGPVVP